MEPSDRALFVAAYSRLVAEVWANPEIERQLSDDPAALLDRYGLALPDGVAVEVVRDAGDAEPDLAVQVSAWEAAAQSGSLLLFVPSIEPVDDLQLAEHELESVVAGIDTSCACCCPCCCT